MAVTTSGPPALPPLEAPRTRRTGNYELYSWVFMRASGVLLIVLVFGHLFVNLMVGDGIERIDFAFVAGKWSDPFWQIWALLMLWLAQLHGTNGMRTIINDYAERDTTRLWLKGALYLATIIVIVVGSMTVVMFDPCIDPDSTLEVCQA